MPDRARSRAPEEDLCVGDSVGIYRKGRLRFTGTVLRLVNANDDLTWGHNMHPDWILTVDVTGHGPRTIRGGRFTAPSLRNVGYVTVLPLGAPERP